MENITQHANSIPIYSLYKGSSLRHEVTVESSHISMGFYYHVSEIRCVDEHRHPSSLQSLNIWKLTSIFNCKRAYAFGRTTGDQNLVPENVKLYFGDV